MKKVKTLVLLIIFVIALIISGALNAQVNIYGSCGAKPNTLENLFTNADKIRQKCIEDIYKENREKTLLEIQELATTIEKLNEEIKKYAIKSSYGLVQCAPRPGEPERSQQLIQRCNSLVATQNTLIDRMNTLTGWSDRPAPKSSDANVEQSITAPCPPKEKINDLKIAANFNKKLHKTWERCRLAIIDSY